MIEDRDWPTEPALLATELSAFVRELKTELLRIEAVGASLSPHEKVHTTGNVEDLQFGQMCEARPQTSGQVTVFLPRGDETTIGQLCGVRRTSAGTVKVDATVQINGADGPYTLTSASKAFVFYYDGTGYWEL